MSKRLTAILQDLKDMYDATAADMTAGEIIALVHACERLDNPFSAVNAELVDRPIHVCKGVSMWPVTVGAHLWLTETAGKWWPEDSAMFRWARVYALIHARDPDAFSGLDDKWTARKAVVKTAMRLFCRVDEIGRAVNAAYGVDEFAAPKDDKANERAQTDFAALVARLEVASGIPAKSWLWDHSMRLTIKSYVELSQLAASVMGADNEKAQIELDAAIENLARVCSAIGERLKKNEQGS